jgi:DNA-binding CsgD family transcriptional regulator
MNLDISISIDKLSKREIELVNLLRQGHAREKIAAIMGISKLTYDSYRKNIRNKLDIKNQSDWARLLYATADLKITYDGNEK